MSKRCISEKEEELCIALKKILKMGRAKRIWYLSPMRAAKVQASLRIRAVSPEPPLLAHTSSESRGTFRQKTRSLAPLNGLTCAVKVCHDGMLEDTNSLGAAQMRTLRWNNIGLIIIKVSWDTFKCCNYPKIWKAWLNYITICPKAAASMANSIWEMFFLLWNHKNSLVLIR